MVKKVIQIGSSLGVTLTSEQLKKLGIGKGASVEVRYNSRRDSIEIFLPREKPKDINEDFLKQVSVAAAKHRGELKELKNDW